MHQWADQSSPSQRVCLEGQCSDCTTDTTAPEQPSTLINKAPATLKTIQKYRFQDKPARSYCGACTRLTITGDAGRQCFSNYGGHLTSSRTVRRLRQNSGKSVREWIQASHWYEILLSRGWETHTVMLNVQNDTQCGNIQNFVLKCLQLFATVMPINEHIGCASSARNNVTSCSHTISRGNTRVQAFWFSSVKYSRNVNVYILK